MVDTYMELKRLISRNRNSEKKLEAIRAKQKAMGSHRRVMAPMKVNIPFLIVKYKEPRSLKGNVSKNGQAIGGLR